MTRDYSRGSASTLVFDDASEPSRRQVLSVPRCQCCGSRLPQMLEKRPTTPYQRVASRLKPVVPSASRRIARVNTLQLIQKVAAVNQIEKLYRFGSHHFGLRNQSFQFSGLFGFCTFLRRRLDLFRCLGWRFVTPIMRGGQMIDHALEDLSRIYFR